MQANGLRKYRIEILVAEGRETGSLTGEALRARVKVRGARREALRVRVKVRGARREALRARVKMPVGIKERESVDITSTLNEVLVKLFRDINNIEEQAVKTGEFRELTVNDMHVIEAIDIYEPKNMTSVARALLVTTGTLTISVNGLVKKGFVERTRSEEDRRVVLVSLTEKGRRAYAQHAQFHQSMIQAVVEGLTQQEQVVLGKALDNLNGFFRKMQSKT